MPGLRGAARRRTRPHKPEDSKRRGLDEIVRRAVPENGISLREFGLGQEGMGLSRGGRRARRFHLRGWQQPVLGRAARCAARAGRSLGKAVRKQPHRFVQGPGHDGAGLHGQPDDRGRQGDPGYRLRVDGRYLGFACGLLRLGRHPGHRVPAQGQVVRHAAHTAHLPRRADPVARYGFRRMHGDRPAGGGERGYLSCEFHELPSPGGPEDDRDRDLPAVRLGGARPDYHTRRQPGQRLCAGQRGF